MKKQNKNNKKDNLYNKDSITVLEGIEAIKHRPQMYIGSLDDDAVIRIIFEVIFNSIDEFEAGFGNQIDIHINNINNIITIRDYGRGIPIGKFKDTNISVFETIVTKIHSGGKFGEKVSYKFASGLHGVGLVVVNALSNFMKIEVYKEDKIYYQNFKNGYKETEQLLKDNDKNDSGTKITFQLNENLFDNKISFDKNIINIINNKLNYLSILNKNLLFHFKINEEKEKNIKSEYSFNNFLRYKFPSFFAKNNIFFFKEKDKNNLIELSFGYNPTKKETIFSFVNNIETNLGGTHVNSLKSTLTRFINNKLLEYNLLSKIDSNISGEDIRNVLCFALHIKIKDPRFSSQTKSKLTNKISKEINDLFLNIFNKFSSINKDEFKEILKLCLLEREKRLFTKNINTPKNNLLQSKIIPCISNDPNIKNLFILEGRSASGSGKKGRNSYFQAILPLRGKILNVVKTNNINKIKNNQELSILTNEIYNGDNSFNIIKYNKVIILSDADNDGHHINLLLITFFITKMPNIIKNGHLYLAVPPLYAIRKKNSGKAFIYLYSEEKLKEFSNNNNMNNFYITRLKGLGEMNYLQLKETVFDNYNNIFQITLDENINNDIILINDFMGIDVNYRKAYILKRT